MNQAHRELVQQAQCDGTGPDGALATRHELGAKEEMAMTDVERINELQAKLAEAEAERDELVGAASLAVMVWLPLLSDVELHPQENEARVALDVLKHALRHADARAGLAGKDSP